MKNDLLLNWPAVAFVYAFTGGGVCAFVPTERLVGAMLVLFVAGLVLACVAWVDHTSESSRAHHPAKPRVPTGRR
ncbi:MAG: hypothetical protein JSR82_16225 [Verrucomicrobia bacterium]|nr:hypothetical protein [Verrucomicrobiota bacterium]